MIIYSQMGQLLVINYSARIFKVDLAKIYEIYIGSLVPADNNILTIAEYQNKEERDRAFEKLTKAVCHGVPFDLQRETEIK